MSNANGSVDRSARRRFLARLGGIAAAIAGGGRSANASSGGAPDSPAARGIPFKPLREADYYKPHDLAG